MVRAVAEHPELHMLPYRQYISLRHEQNSQNGVAAYYHRVLSRYSYPLVDAVRLVLYVEYESLSMGDLEKLARQRDLRNRRVIGWKNLLIAALKEQDRENRDA